MEVRIDYRAVLSEVLERAAASRHIDEVFPNYKPQRVGLVG
jgi:hypothetical protein